MYIPPYRQRVKWNYRPIASPQYLRHGWASIAHAIVCVWFPSLPV